MKRSSHVWFSHPRRPASPIHNQRYHTAPYVLAGRRGDNTFLLNKKTGKYYRLDDVGSELWTILRRPLSMPDLLAELSMIYEMPPQALADDVSTLVATLLSYDVIACNP
jgi:hypothetical protein